ncbi:hypothetical protein OEZ85_000275 [Tetradesmus obliquus]|uniref:DNA 3'-5' helicase n=1 Tax=Tetradesmus obliquus TaxID=3088 RepID=A0ABY8UPR0_TETOB|nr:hypothetical protein OEZ85_000275 [Tetradesmus obliquus]
MELGYNFTFITSWALIGKQVQRAASRGLARLIAEEGGVPQDHSLAAPPPGADTRFLRYDDPDSPILSERRSARAVQRRTIDASQYVDPDEMDFEGQEWLMPEQPEVKPEKPKREPRPKKPKPERRPEDAQQHYVDDDDEEFDLAMEDNMDDEDFDAAMEMEDEAMEPSGLSGGGAVSGGGGKKRRGRSKAAAAAGSDDEDDFGDLVDEESDEEAWTAGGGGGAYDDEEDEEDGFEGGTVIGGGYSTVDYSSLSLKGDHFNRPLWVCSDGRIFLETYSPIYKQAYDFLIAIAEPVCRPESIHEYVLTPQSLYAAVSVGLDRETILGVLDKLSKVRLTSKLRRFIAASTKSYGKVKLVLKHNRFWVETSDMEVLARLLDNPTIQASRALDTPGADSRGLQQQEARAEKQRQRQAKQQQQQQQQDEKAAAAATAAAAAAADGDAAAAAGYEEQEEEEDPEREVLAFEIRASEVERVKKECLPGSASGLDCPLLEEYDFAHDDANPGLDIGLKRGVQLRPYQEKSLAKMFGNGRARSGIIVLPCGAGKSLVGVAAAARVKKSCLCLCTSSVSVDQWAHQFTLWTNLQEHDVVKFVAGTGGNEGQAEFNKQRLAAPCICVTTFNMIAHGGKRSEYGKAIMDLISGKEWGLLLLDEVHVVPARMFRQVIGIVKAHCKLGLTATLVREDELIGDLNFLIGPKLYEANWLDLTRAGHIANVQCVEVWCPMTREFYAEYLNREAQNDSVKQLLYVMNPNKFMVCQYLIDWHERIRGDKVIVFSDNVYALEAYAKALRKPFIYGKTSHSERTQVLSIFKNTNKINTVFLSKVGDNSLDIPEANVLIQISSHAGSRRQEAQRLGRILRAKKGKPGSGEEEEFSAFFYTLVSRDTQEMYYSAKRQQFLVDQGYAFKVLPALHTTAAAEPWIQCRTQREQLELLSQVLHSKELADSLARECGKDALEAGDKDDLVTHQRGWGGGVTANGGGGKFGSGRGRKLGSRSMGKAAGGGDFVYNEWSKQQQGSGRGRVQVSGPGGAVERQEKAARAKKLRQKLAG